MDEQLLQQQIVQLVLAAMQGDQLATLQIQQIMLAALLGNPEATLIAQMIQLVAQAMQLLQVRAAKFGAKLNYIKQLRGECPDGYEMQYFKSGGPMGNPVKKCVKCLKQQMANGGKSSIVDSFKCGRKTKKALDGSKLPMDKCGGQAKRKKQK